MTVPKPRPEKPPISKMTPEEAFERAMKIKIKAGK